MTTVDLTLNGVPLSSAVPEALVLDVSRPLVGKRRHTTVDIPGRAGSWRFNEEPGDRTIEITLDLEAETFAARRDAVRRLAYWADVGDTANLYISDEPDRFHEALLDSDDAVLERLCYGETTIEFLVGPYALATGLSTETITANSNPDSDTFDIPDAVTAEPVVEITPAGGGLTGFTLTVNGYAITWAGTLNSGETLTISSLSDTVTTGENEDVNLTGTFDEDDVDMADVSGEFPLLFEGTQSWSILWTGAATSVGVVFTWRERSR